MPHCITLALCIYFTNNILDYLWYITEHGVKYKLYRGHVFRLSTPREDQLLTQRQNSAPKVYVSYTTLFPGRRRVLLQIQNKYLKVKHIALNATRRYMNMRESLQIQHRYLNMKRIA